MGFVIFAVIALVVAILWHKLVKNFGAAVLGATATSVALFQALVYLVEGHFGAFIMVAVAVSAVIAAVLSVLVGLMLRRRAANVRNASHAP